MEQRVHPLPLPFSLLPVLLVAVSCAEALRAVCERADSLQSGAVMAVFRGRVILACGDVSRKFEAYSVRKSLVSGLYGTAVARGEIDLDSTLADFSIDEQTAVTLTLGDHTLRASRAPRQ